MENINEKDIYNVIKTFDDIDHIENWIQSPKNDFSSFNQLFYKLVCHINDDNIIKVINFLYKFNNSELYEYLNVLAPYGKNYIEDLIKLSYNLSPKDIKKCVKLLICYVSSNKDIKLLIDLSHKSNPHYIYKCIEILISKCNEDNILSLIKLAHKSSDKYIHNCINILIPRCDKDNILSLIELAPKADPLYIDNCIKILIPRCDKDNILSLIELAHKSNSQHIFDCIKILIPYNCNVKLLINLINEKVIKAFSENYIFECVMDIYHHIKNDDDIESILEWENNHFKYKQLDVNDLITQPDVNDLIDKSFNMLISKVKDIKLFVKYKNLITPNILYHLRFRGLDLDTINTENIKIDLSDEEKILMSLIKKEKYRSTSDLIPKFEFKIDYYTYLIHVGFLEFNTKDLFDKLVGYNNVENSNLYYPLMLQRILENNLQVSYDDIENLRNYMDIKREENILLKEESEKSLKEESKK